MGLPIEFYVYVGYGIFAMVVMTIFYNFILGGLFGPFFKVKRSRGKMLLVLVRHPIQDYFRAGEIQEGFLVFTDRQKNERRLPMLPGVVSRKAGIFWVEVDDEKNCFFKRDTGEAVSGFDAVKYDELYKRALYKPLTLGDNLLKAVLVLVILLLLATIIGLVLTFKQGQSIDQILGLVQAAGVAAKNVTGVVA